MYLPDIFFRGQVLNHPFRIIDFAYPHFFIKYLQVNCRINIC